MGKKIYIYPLWLRIWHWSNALAFLLLIVSGISLHYANINSPLIPFNTARIIHNITGVFLSIIYIGYLIGNFISGNWRQYFPVFKGLLKRLIIQTRFYIYGIFKGEPHPYHVSEEQKFNPLQQITYLSVVYFFMILLIVSGLFLLFPAIAPHKIFNMGGIWPMAVLHAAVAFFLSIFMVAHIYLATLSGKIWWEDFKNMVTGWHEIEDNEHEQDNNQNNNK
ncbi:MAG: cytochrome B [Chlorobi bacterium]|nr:cytochrome B [Chlorobiota bacterium]